VVKGGNSPLDVLGANVDRYIAGGAASEAAGPALHRDHRREDAAAEQARLRARRERLRSGSRDRLARRARAAARESGNRCASCSRLPISSRPPSSGMMAPASPVASAAIVAVQSSAAPERVRPARSRAPSSRPSGAPVMSPASGRPAA
jgi:hypothetical protein